VTLRPGDLVGLPWPADPATGAIALRYILLALSLVVAALAARGRRTALVLATVVFVEAVIVVWTASLARPYGLFADAQVTRAAAEASVARLPGDDGALSGEARSEGASVRLVRWGVEPRTVIAGPSLLPLIAIPALGLLVFALWRREEAAEAAVLWLAFSTADAAAARGEGFLTGLWARPAGALVLVAVAAAVLAAGRLRSRMFGVGLGLLAMFGLAVLRGSPGAPPLGERLLAATFEQGPWLVLGAWGLARGAPSAAWSLVLGGATLYLLGPHVTDTWAAHAAYRLGLILASTAPLLVLTRTAGDWLVPERLRRALAPATEQFGFAALLALTLPGCFAARWNPAALDPIALASFSPLSTNLKPGLDWLRAHTPPGATCLASPDYAALVAVAGGRRVLRAPDLWEPADDQRRRRVERMLVEEREPELLRRYQVGCVFFASSDVGWLDTRTREDLDRLRSLRLGYADVYTRVYLLNGAGASPRSP
jgi:hypothetical protein